MRSLRNSVTLLAFVGLLRSVGHGPSAAEGRPTPSALLELRPVLSGSRIRHARRPGGDQCMQGRERRERQKHSVGYALRDGQGKMLRRFVIAHGGRRLDQWSYFQDGFEVYREDDLDGDRSLDECRWLNTGGTRIALVTKGKIKGWKQISAEEASKVLVAGPRGRRRRPARDSHGDAGRAGGRGCAQGGRRQGRRGRPQAQPSRWRRFKRRWSAGMTRRSGTDLTARFPT